MVVTSVGANDTVASRPTATMTYSTTSTPTATTKSTGVSARTLTGSHPE